MFQMKTKIFITIFLIIIVVGSLVVYGNIEEKMDMYGRITKIVYDEQGKLKEIYVDNISEDKKPYDMAVVIISGETDLFNDNFEKGNLLEGQILGIIFKDRPITMIYPARVEAKRIRIKDSGDKLQNGPIVNSEIEDNNQSISEKDQLELVMQKYHNLLQEGIGVSTVIEFINKHIPFLPLDKATQMINLSIFKGVIYPI